MSRPFLALLLALATGSAGAASSTVLPGELSLQNVATGFSSPLAVRSTPDPADARLFVLEQGGRVRIVSGGSIAATPFLNINAGAGGTAPPFGFTTGGERGLLGLAFHPSYAVNGRFFVSYTDGNGDTVVARYQVSGNPDVASTTGTVVLHVDQDFSNHNGGDVQFGADGYLYLGLGDGGSGDDPCNRAQTLLIGNLLGGIQNGEDCTADAGFAGNGGDPASLALLGKMLRVDVDGTTSAAGERCAAGGNGTANYAIPADNPYAPADGICDEVWHAGLRNPFRFSFDRANGDLFIGDVGQVAREEVDYAPGGVGGLNFGWRCREGDIAGARGAGCPAPSAFVEPIAAYGRSLGSTVTGGYRYRGPLDALEGIYFYADFGSGRIWATRPYAGAWSNVEWQNTALNPSSFGEGSDGAVYVVDYNGSVLLITTPWLFRDGLEPND
jgi:glucose/arabinose dehydrogenase